MDFIKIKIKFNNLKKIICIKSVEIIKNEKLKNNTIEKRLYL